jgi:FkbM family methyltransferase
MDVETRPPFEMMTETEMERYRARTWATKEPETIAWIDWFDDGDVFFDVGANIGIYSLYCAKKHPNSVVVAFEADEHNYGRLVLNGMLNGFGDRLKAHNYMISDQYGRAVFSRPAGAETGSSGGQVVKDESGIEFARRLDELVVYSFDFPTPNHVKIDIDGQELAVVYGMGSLLRDRRLKSVLVETTPEDRREITAALESNGFSTNNRFNMMGPHSRDRRAKEGINVENIVFTRS